MLSIKRHQIWLLAVWSPGILSVSEKQKSTLYTPMWLTEIHMKKCLLRQRTHMVTNLLLRKPCHVSLCRHFQRVRVTLTVSSVYKTVKTKTSPCSLINSEESFLLTSLQLAVNMDYNLRKKRDKWYYCELPRFVFIPEGLTNGKNLHITQLHLLRIQNTPWSLERHHENQVNPVTLFWHKKQKERARGGS